MAALLLGSGHVHVPAQARDVILATTTNVQGTGLLEGLLPLFERESGVRVKTIVVDSGDALKLGARGDVDVVLVHAPDLELQYLQGGAFVDRHLVMHDDFILVGPPLDPGRVRTLKLSLAALALKQIAEARVPFVSRGDSSGTHARELALWKDAGVIPRGDWYIESGQGMGATLLLASEKRAYTLADRGTYLAFARRVGLSVVLDGDPSLLNEYHVMRPDPARNLQVNGVGGQAFADFLVSPHAQAMIGAFGVDRYGAPVFVPDAGGPKPR